MGFVKLDCGIVRSTIWYDKPARDVFITALLLAEPCEFSEPVQQIDVDSLEFTGWVAPAGWYGFVPASAPGILSLAGIDREAGYEALRRLGAPEPESRSQDFDGRRLIRIDGGYMVLNYMRYREKDHTTAERSRRYRERKRHAVAPDRHAVTSRSVTQAEAEAEAEGRKDGTPSLPPADRAERAIRLSTDALRTKLYGLIDQMTTEDPKQSDPTELMRLVTAYEKPDGTRVKGVVNAALLGHERLERSIADAEEMLRRWRNGSKA